MSGGSGWRLVETGQCCALFSVIVLRLAAQPTGHRLAENGIRGHTCRSQFLYRIFEDREDWKWAGIPFWLSKCEKIFVQLWFELIFPPTY